MSKIVLEDFNEGDGYYKINLAYLNKEQIKEIETLVSKWNPVEESEDKRIKNEIIKLVHFYYGSSLLCKHTVSEDKMITWLKKQVEQINLPQFTFDDVIALQCCMDTSKKVQKDEELYHRLQSLHDRLHDAAYWLGKQGEKPTEKLEPKFKVGDWLVENEPNNYARFIQILEVINVYGKERYKISRDLHNDEDVVECRFIENNYHSFTIQDAKEGDVLTDNLSCFDNPFIFILKRFENVYFGLPRPSDFSSHCFLTMSDKQEFREGDYHHMHNICPATKEQRDLLFQKMHEAGYMLNTESKQISSLKVEPTRENKHLELEDERIRQALLEYFGEECDTVTINGIYCYKIYDWLKKQGNKSEEHVFSPMTGCSIDEAARQAIDKTRNGENIVFSFNGFYMKIYNDTTVDNIVNSYNDFCKKQSEQKPKKVPIWRHWKDGIAGNGEGEQTFLIKNGLTYSISSCLGQECDYIELSELDELLREEKQGKHKWTEEDDCYMSECISAIATKEGWSFEEKRKTKHWLKSIKQRMKE